MSWVWGPQNGRRSAVKNKITIILHNQNTVWVHTTGVTSPLGMLVLTRIAWIVNNQVAVGLHNHMQVAVKPVGVWSPNRLVSIVVNNEVSITLHYSVEDTVSTNKFFSNIKSRRLEKAVTFSAPECNVLGMIILIAFTIIVLVILLVWVWGPKLSGTLTE